MIVLKKLAIIGLVAFSSLSQAVISTNFTTLKSVNYDGAADNIYFVAKDGWTVKDSSGATLCTPKYVYTAADLPGRNNILSVGLAAYMGNKKVQLQGVCEGATYFKATYIVLGES